MTHFKLTQGLDLPILGKPKQEIHNGPAIETVAVLAEDYIDLKPRMHVQEGDQVKLGQVLFTDKQNEEIAYTSPASGEIQAIHRGEKRALISVVIAIKGTAERTFQAFKGESFQNLSREQVSATLLESGLWTALRTRPFSKVADPQKNPSSIFVTAVDTNPLAPSMEIVLQGNEEDFQQGLIALTKLTHGVVFVCHAAHENIPQKVISGVLYQSFAGPHPSGLVGTHIHHLDPVSRKSHVWHIQAQDVVAVGKLLRTGKLDVSRIVSFAGTGVREPRLIRTRLGASIHEISHGAIAEGEMRMISGSVLSGRIASGPRGYLGRYHQCISVIPEDRKQTVLGWIGLGLNRFSFTRTVLSKLMMSKQFDLGTSTHGGLRAIVPIGVYEEVMPLDILPTFLFKALAIQDLEEAEHLGCLELDEEDLALCSFVCPSKIDHMSLLRKTLHLIDKEG